MNYPLVSFIVGVYNTKNFDDLRRSAQSMLSQTYPNIEIVFCDDCSTNGVYEWLLEHYGSYPNVTIIRNTVNCGLAGTLNHCLEYAKGQYIARQDDDDYIETNKIALQMDFLKEHTDYHFVSTGLCKFDAQGIWDSYTPKAQPCNRDFRYHSQHVHAATLFRKECLQSVNGYRISKETQRAEDYDLFMRLYAIGYKGYNLQEILYYYNYPRGNARKIKYRYKIKEAVVRYKGFKQMHLPIRDYIFVLKPLIAGLLPNTVKQRIKNFQRKK